jgi:hypothetical protein
MEQYADDPFISLTYAKWQKDASSESDLDTRQIFNALQENPDFTPLLTYAVYIHKIRGLLDKELSTAEHIIKYLSGPPGLALTGEKNHQYK